MTDTEHEVNILDAAREAEPSPQTKAVALQYEREEDDAPRIVASGKGAIAEQILQVAFANNIKVREDAELVEILSLLDVDSPIPLEAFAAVAEILTYVYEANASFKQRSVT
jgi:flagellar biosynthesis protein